MNRKMKYYVRSGWKVDCLMGCAKGKTEVSFLYYLWLKFLGYSVFKQNKELLI